MNVKRFFAPSAREALRRLKEEMGGDAIVLSSRSVDGGVEILALPPGALSHMTPQPAPAAVPTVQPASQPTARLASQVAAQPASQPASLPTAKIMAQRQVDVADDYTVSLSGGAKAGQAMPWRPFEAPRVAPAAQPAPERQRALEALPLAPPARAAQPEGAVPAAPIATPAVAAAAPNPQLMQELGAIRGLIERQLAGFAWGDLKRESPVKSRLLGELLEMGFSSELTRRLLDHVLPDADDVAARTTIRTLVNRDLVTLSSDTDIIDRGGVYALVGPTGVGKTTTTAKLAARCVVRHGAERVALLTTDSYRIGAHEQLRIYGRILGVAVHAVRDTADLRQTLEEFRHKHMVLIDTVGMSQRDRQVAEQTAMLLNAGDVRRLLLLNASSRGDTLEDVVRAYSGPDLVGAIVTKVDEAISLAPVLDVLIRQELELFYVANGQRVPEDLHLPNRTYLLHRALKAATEGSPFHYMGDEAGLLLAASQAAQAVQAAMGASLA